jgi:hypothetical protein
MDVRFDLCWESLHFIIFFDVLVIYLFLGSSVTSWGLDFHVRESVGSLNRAQQFACSCSLFAFLVGAEQTHLAPSSGTYHFLAPWPSFFDVLIW